MLCVLLCSVMVENVKELSSEDQGIYPVQSMLMVCCKSCFTGQVLTV